MDLDNAIWTVPAPRMKSDQEHRVPLSGPALDILAASDITLSAVLRRMGHGDLTVHGFRSTFRDWAAETTGYPNHVVEQALAHAIGSAVEAAYRRGDLFEKRLTLMDDWAAFLAKPPAQVIRPTFGGRADVLAYAGGDR